MRIWRDRLAPAPRMQPPPLLGIEAGGASRRGCGSRRARSPPLRSLRARRNVPFLVDFARVSLLLDATCRALPSRLLRATRPRPPGRVEEGRRSLPSSGYPRDWSSRARGSPRSARARVAPRRVRRPVGVHVRRIRDHGHSPRPRRCDIRGALEGSGAVAVLRARDGSSRPPPFGATGGRGALRRRRRPRRRGRRLTSRRPARSPRTDRARRLREPPPWRRRLRRPRSRRTLAGTPEAARRSRATADTRQDEAAAARAIGLQVVRCSRVPGDVARAREVDGWRPSARQPPPSARGGEERRGRRRASRRGLGVVVRKARRPPAAHGTPPRLGRGARFSKTGWRRCARAGPALRVRRRRGAAPEAERHLPARRVYRRGSRATPRRTYRTPSPNGGAARTTATATRTASPFSRFPRNSTRRRQKKPSATRRQ